MKILLSQLLLKHYLKILMNPRQLMSKQKLTELRQNIPIPLMLPQKLSLPKDPSKNLDSDYIPDRINEETLRHIESATHNAQSMYDTYIHKTPLESQDNDLRTLRGHISITLHLLGIAKELCHFTERHETTIRNECTHQRYQKS